MKKWFNSAGYALKGISSLLKSERNARIEFTAALLVVLLCTWLSISAIQWSCILFSIGAVLSAEAFNSAVEKLSDLYTREHHAGIGNIKDISAGAVLIACITSMVIGMIILGPLLLKKFGIN